MDSKFDLIDLQRAANYLMVQNKLKPSGISGIVFGAIALLGAWGVNTIQDQILAIVGLFLIFEGIWVLAWPSVNGILLNSIGIAVVGIYNIVISFLPGQQSAWPIFGLFQLHWSYSRYKEYKMFRSMTVFPPSSEAYRFMKSLVKDIETRETETSGNMISFLFTGVVYKAILMDRSAVLVSSDGKVILVWNRQDVDLARVQDSSEGPNVKVSGSVIHDLVAVMPDVYYNRYEAWKNGASLYSPDTVIRKCLKSRTIILAQVLLTISTGLLLFTIIGLISVGITKNLLLGIVFFAASITPLVLWSKLLRLQSWAWTTLIILESILSFTGSAFVLWVLYRMNAAPRPNDSWLNLTIAFLVIAGLFYTPLLMLITDRPSGWRRTESLQSVPEVEIA